MTELEEAFALEALCDCVDGLFVHTVVSPMTLRSPRQTSPASLGTGLDKSTPPPNSALQSLGERLARCSQPTLIALTWGLLLLVGGVDYLTGYEISVTIFYLLPVSLAAWFVSRRFAVLVSSLSVGIWLAGDIGAGAIFRNKALAAWNAAIVLGFFLVVTWLLASLRRSVLDLEERVHQRTIALTEEMEERARLETEILEISEREQRRIGHDLHDGLGQHLTGTALAGQVLGDRLEARGPSTEAAETGRVVELIEEAIGLTALPRARALAGVGGGRGLDGRPHGTGGQHQGAILPAV